MDKALKRQCGAVLQCLDSGSGYKTVCDEIASSYIQTQDHVKQVKSE